MSKFLLAAAAIAGTVAPAAAFAENPPPAGQPAMGGRIELRSEVAARTTRLFAMLDTNHDGFLDQAELNVVGSGFGGGQSGPASSPHRMPLDRNAMFDMIDTDHDGMISRDEFARAPGLSSEAMTRVGGGGRRDGGGYAGMARAMMAADTDHDGKVTLKEATDFAFQQFDRQDVNHDGQVTPEERAAYRAQRQQIRGQ